MKNLVIDEIKRSLKDLNYEFENGDINVNVPKNKEFGDLSTNIAFLLSKKNKKNPIEISTEIRENLISVNLFREINIAGPGFLNFKINPKSIVNYISEIIKENENYGKTNPCNKKVLVEFVSANPTGPLTVGHGRGAILGDTLSNIFEWNGYTVEREYYYNNAGRQMRILGESVQSRFMELVGKKYTFPEDGYQGDYIISIAKEILEKHGKNLNEDNDFFKEYAEKFIFNHIKKTLKNLDISFDSFFNEKTLYDNKEIYNVIDKLKSKKLIYEKDGAVWFKGTEVGRDNDRVLIKKNR